jgi:hypothetical protein
MRQPAEAWERAFPLRRALVVLAAALSTVASAEESNGVSPIALSAAPVSFFIDRRLPPEFRPAVEEARRRLSDSRCADVLTDFEDVEGRRLDLKVADLKLTAAAYLSFVLFYDGRPTPECGFKTTLAWTTTGSRAVHVCYSQFLAQQRWNAGYTANTLIHEMLHTLGLGETPPDPRVITARVAERCGN